ncbi:haloalkane dehalogenase [Pavlovales sp. CCMP2436]|nr:haloalkane dehalogenase [Pavlovales sp. CCMP2436]
MPISSAFPFESKFVYVHGFKMHYVEQGQGDPILFLHGNPTSCYLWRNVIPHVSKGGRAIAVDLIGMGKSDKPDDLGYTYDDHTRFVSGFIKALDLKDITLVIHDWGSLIGFRYAHEHEANVRGIAFMEATVRPLDLSDLPLDTRIIFPVIRTFPFGYLLIQAGNIFLNKLLPDMIIRKLAKEEVAAYKAPFPTIKSRKPVAKFPSEVPFSGKPAANHQTMVGYSEWLKVTQMPKLFLKFSPGVAINKEMAEWIEKTLPNLTTVDCGAGRHFVQEDEPDAIGQAIAAWMSTQLKK